MKELEGKNEKLNDEIREERQEIKELSLMGELQVPRGHTVYEYNNVKKILKKAEYTHTSIMDLNRGAITNDGPEGKPIGTIIKGKIKFDPDKIYFTALNWKNAVRKLENMLREVDSN